MNPEYVARHLPHTRRITTYDVVKRLLDVVLAVVGLLLLAPFIFLAWLLIRFGSRGPGFYRGMRVGLWGRPFRMYKLRTMVANADDLGPSITVNADPRITPLGSWLRDRRLDEFPQLINVLRGEMSLVGPRPEVMEYVLTYTPQQLQVLTVKPGVTGPMQIAFLEEEGELADPLAIDDVYLTRILPAKLEIELEYLRKRSLFYDLRIIFQTVLALWPSFWDSRQGV